MSGGAAGLLLAAGSSEPLGEPVQLLDVGGRPLLEVMVGRMAGWLRPLVVVLGWRAEEILEATDLRAALIIIDDDWQAGAGSWVQTGLDHLSRERVHVPVFVTRVDQPGVTEAHLQSLEQAHAGGVTIPVYRHDPGYPLLIDRSQWDRFLSRSLDPLDIARAHPEWVTEVRGDERAPRRVRVPADIDDVLPRFGAA